jgi:hypothetical protein
MRRPQPSLDDLRALRPDLSLALYAMTPGGPVTLEIYHEGQVYSFSAPTEADAILAAFPPEQPDADDAPDVATHDSIFD